MDIVLIIELAILAYAVQWLTVVFAIGIATDFSNDPDCGTVCKWAAIWPYLLVKLICRMIYRLVTYRRWQRTKTIARLEDQHRNYIKGLMDEDDEAYVLGLYGEYPPAKVEWEKA